jgi:uncharacterized repeat protein (TIGR03803 family)
MAGNTVTTCRLVAGISFILCARGAGAPPAADRAILRVVSSMNGYSQPWGLIEGSPGVFYGSAKVAPSGLAAAYSITAQGAAITLTTFPVHYNINAPLVDGLNGLFYASVQHILGSANVFSVGSAPGTVQVYANQTVAPLLSQNLPNGALLGIAADASNGNPYSLVTVDPSGVATPIHRFLGGDSTPSNVVYATDGNYYGVASGNSTYVCRVTPSGAARTLFTFPAVPFPFAGMPPASLLQADDGDLYGVLPSGGTNGTGAVYKLTLAGQYTLLYSFPSGQNGGPTALIEGSDGNLYGATQGYVYGGTYGGYGLLFRVTKSGQYTLLKSMDNGAVTGSCQCTLLLGSDGIIYGTTTIGGKYGGGTVFALDAGLPKPKPRAMQFAPTSGAAGTAVRIWGYDLLSATVEFNSVPATTVSNSGPNYVFATVPPGATTGPITVTTPGGTSTTHASFTVQ